jgi:hypothetical protein
MEETSSRFGGYLLIYLIRSCGQTTRGGPPVWGLVEGLTTPCRKKTSLLQNVSQGLRIVHILWNDLGNWKWTRDFKHGMLGCFIVHAH